MREGKFAMVGEKDIRGKDEGKRKANQPSDYIDCDLPAS